MIRGVKGGVLPTAVFRALMVGLLTTGLMGKPVSLLARDFEAQPARQVIDAANSVLLDITQAAKRLVAVGERGIIVYSDDRGQSWQQASVPVSNTLTAVQFVDAKRGWAAGHGGVILHSSDGGQSWQKQFDGNQANVQWLRYVQSRKAELEERLAELSAGGGSATEELEYQLEDSIYAEEDAQLAIENGPVDPFLDIWFSNADNGIAVGAYGMIYRTENGGKNWVLAASGIANPDRYHLYAIDSDTQGRLFLSGEAGLMYRSVDGGRNWHRLGPFYDGSLFGVVTHGETVLTFGLRGNIFKTVDGGQQWQPLTPAAFSLYGGSRLDNGEIVLVGAAGGYALSRDGSSFHNGVNDSRSSFSAVSGDGSGKILAVGIGGVHELARGDGR